MRARRGIVSHPWATSAGSAILPGVSLYDRMTDHVRDLQARIIEELERIDGGRFRIDDWSRPEVDLTAADESLERPLLDGGGSTRVMEEGEVFERAAVNVSVVGGLLPASFAAKLPGEGRAFKAVGVSLVIHPRNPYVPTVHMNIRRLEKGDAGWFGGGSDLTPYYLDEDDARSFHLAQRAACDAHPGVADYPTMKRDCDAYFHLPHRGEARGIGGIFFDHLREQPEETFAFVKAAGEAFLEGYLPIVRKHVDRPYGEREREWQLVRRGRYVEFNLMYDRGTIFGLKSGGRIESILVSLPHAVWKYRVEPEAGSPEAQLLDVLTSPRDWV